MTTVLWEYQSRIVKEIHGNAIVVLPTGAGKTLIASRVCDGALRRPASRVLFIVPTRVLVTQQADYLESETAVKASVIGFKGDDATPEMTDILVATPTAFLELAAKIPERYCLKFFTLVVFDEVHHLRGKHPYTDLNEEIRNLCKSPQILGLTASLSYRMGRTEIAEDIATLCEELQVPINASGLFHGSDEELEIPAIAKPTMKSTHIPSAEDTPSKYDAEFGPSELKELFFHRISLNDAPDLALCLVRLARSLESRLSLHNFSSPLDDDTAAREWGKYAYVLFGKYKDLESNEAKLTALLLLILTFTYEWIRILVVSKMEKLDVACWLVKLFIPRDDGKILALHEHGQTVQKEYQWLNQDKLLPEDVGRQLARLRALAEAGEQNTKGRVGKLRQVLVDTQARRGEEFHGIIFVQERSTALALELFVRQKLPQFACRAVAATSATGGAVPFMRLQDKEFNQRVVRFKSKDYNLLISTMVCEEGVDIKSANEIIRFDRVTTPVSHVQGRGRARQEDSSLNMLVQAKGKSLLELQHSELQQRSLLANPEEITRALRPKPAASRAVSSISVAIATRNAMVRLNEKVQKNSGSIEEQYKPLKRCEIPKTDEGTKTDTENR